MEIQGWILKVGDVYSNPFHYTHFKITEIEHDHEDSENTLIKGVRVDPDDYSKVINDSNETTEMRAWYLNDYFALETI